MTSCSSILEYPTAVLKGTGSTPIRDLSPLSHTRDEWLYKPTTATKCADLNKTFGVEGSFLVLLSHPPSIQPHRKAEILKWGSTKLEFKLLLLYSVPGPTAPVWRTHFHTDSMSSPLAAVFSWAKYSRRVPWRHSGMLCSAINSLTTRKSRWYRAVREYRRCMIAVRFPKMAA